MLKFIGNLFGEKKETKTVSDIMFDIMFFIDTEAPKLMHSVKTEEELIRKIIVPFNYLLVPVTLGAKVYKTKEGELSLLFREYDLSEKEISQLAYLADKFNDEIEEFYKNLQVVSDDDTDITKIPARRDNVIFEKEVSIKKIPEIVFGKCYDGLISKRINGNIVEKLAANGKEIANAIKKKTMWIYGGIISTLLVVATTGGFFYYKKKSDDETTVESSETEIIDVETSDVESEPYVEAE